ncbi:hypothetical protein [Pseudogemmobacter faecipullorum]|uniref:Flp pilus assembly protein CpaB n=1 Tax=Pseudogemmobacter faecipullorum TaxID=2755041 RepID=A0ABS8CH93_9RHOB|nr:hypothetical protein [Pseudogemmobacter faecipullorum]MCB5408729.1 hypothetical protein [Pseudogemmobacter faecipullorum]
MRTKIFALILLGIALALAGAFGTFHYTRALEAELASARVSLRAFGETAPIPVPVRDMAAGEILGPADFMIVEIPLAYLPPNVLRELPPPGPEPEPAPAEAAATTPEAAVPLAEAAADNTAIDGAPAPPAGHLVALSPLKQGSFLFDAELGVASRQGNGALLPAANGRIFALSLRNDKDFGSGLREGSFVDLFWTQPIGGGKTETRLLASGLRLRQMPLVAVPPETSPRRFLLEGTIEQAAQMLVASQSGSFDILLSDGSRSTRSELALIGPTELQSLPLTYRDGDSAGAAPPASLVGRLTGAPEQRETCPTAVIRGGARTIAEVPC